MNGRRGRGFSLIETAVAVALLAIIVVTILSAFSAVSIATTRHQQLTALDRWTRSDAEFIKSQTYSMTAAAYSNLSVSGYSFSYQVLFYNPTSDSFGPGNPDIGLQEIALTVSGPNSITEVLYFLKVQP